MARADPQVNIRIPEELKAKLDKAATDSGRSLTAEIVYRLGRSFPTFEEELINARVAESRKIDREIELLKDEQREFLYMVEAQAYGGYSKEFVDRRLSDLHLDIIRMEKLREMLTEQLIELTGEDDLEDEEDVSE